MSDTLKLRLYNDALLVAGERALASLTENREPRYLLDQVWASNALNLCLEEAQWHFAMRTIQIDYDTAVEPGFGYNRAFQKPEDWILTSAVASDEFFRAPLTQYADEAGYWYASIDTLYVRYVSNDANYGGNMGKWPATFWDFVAADFAGRLLLKVSNDEARVKLVLNPENPRNSIRGRRLLAAKSRSAMANPTMIAAQGQWSRSRTRGVNRRDGGDMGSLIG